MTSFLLGLVGALLLTALFNIPRVIIARHHRKLAEARLELVQCVTSFQKHLRDSQIVCGEHCHDWLASAMQHAQFADTYGTFWMIFRKTPNDLSRMLDRLECEIASKPEEFQKVIDVFFKAYGKALRYRQPITFWCLIIMALLRLWAQHVQLTRGNLSAVMARMAVVSHETEPLPA